MGSSEANQKTMNITLWQQTCLITSTLFGVGVLTLPRTATSHLYEAGWMSPVFGAMFALVSIWMIAMLSRRFPGMTFIEYSPIIFGTKKTSAVGRLLSLPWILFYLLFLLVTTAFTARIFGSVVVTAVLRETPLEVIIVTMCFLAVFLSMHEVEVVARVNELLFPLIVLPVLIIALASFQKAEWEYLFPLFRGDVMAILKEVSEASYSYQGYEIMLIFFAFANRNSGKGKAGFYGILITMIVYTLIVVAGIAVFGYDELQLETWPTLELVKTTQVPGQILERLESAFLTVWVVAVFTTVANSFYAVVFGLRQLFNKGIGFQRIISIPLAFLMVYISLLPENVAEIFEMSAAMGMLSLIINLGIPALYWLIVLLRGKGIHPEERKVDG